MDVMEKKMLEIIGDIPKRAVLAVSKFIGVKGAIWGTATAFLWFGKIEVWAWVAVSLVVIFGREALKVLKDLR